MKTTTLATLSLLASVLLAVVLNSLIIQLCWNYFVPAVSALPQIDFLQALTLGVGIRALKGAKFELTKGAK